MSKRPNNCGILRHQNGFLRNKRIASKAGLRQYKLVHRLTAVSWPSILRGLAVRSSSRARSLAILLKAWPVVVGCWLMAWMILCPNKASATILWSDLSTTLVHETGGGSDILGGTVKEDDSSTNTLYFKFHVDLAFGREHRKIFLPPSSCTTRETGSGSASATRWKAWAYSAFKADATGVSDEGSDYVNLHSSKPEQPGTPGNFFITRIRIAASKAPSCSRCNTSPTAKTW